MSAFLKGIVESPAFWSARVRAETVTTAAAGERR
jgi:hypothetical protein